MSKATNRPMQCCDFESLSSAYDNEDSLNQNQQEHLQSCDECRKIIETFSQIEQSIKNKNVLAMESFDLEIIRQNVYEQLALPPKTPPIKRYFKWQYLNPVAAALLIGIGIHYLFVNPDLLRKNIDSSDITMAQIANMDQMPSFFTPEGYDKLNQYVLSRWKSNGSIGDSVLPAEPDGIKKHIFNICPLAAPVDIPLEVTQVWITDNCSKSNRRLKNIFEELNVSPENYSIHCDGKTVKLDCKITKAQLVTLVRKAHSPNQDLLVPSIPDPEQRFFIGQADEVVIYRADFIFTESIMP